MVVVLLALLAMDAFLCSFVFSSRVRSWVVPFFEKGPIAIPYEPTMNPPEANGFLLQPSKPIDLDGDGKPEDISVLLFSYSGYGSLDTARLQIGSATTTIDYSLAANTIFETKLGDYGERSAIALTLSLPNEQVTQFFGYEDGRILSLGMVPGAFDALVFDKNHHIHTVQRGRLLDTWFRDGEYALTAKGILEENQKPFYKRHTPVRMKQDFTFVVSPSSARVAFLLKAGDQVTITGCDELTHCSLQTKSGKIGWFELGNGNLVMPTKDGARPIEAFELFDGLSNAG